jgi:diguanylate cyclase (GGDEF)-like protein
MAVKNTFNSEGDDSDDAHTLLSDALYVSPGSLFVGAVITAGIALMCAAISGTTAPLFIAGLILAVYSIRVVVANHRSRLSREFCDLVFTSSAVAHLVLIGVLTFWAFRYSHDPVVLTLTLTVSIVNTMSIGLRSFSSDAAVKSQLVAAVTPVACTFFLNGGYFFVAFVTQILLGFYVFLYSSRFRQIFLSEFRHRRRSETIASRFRFAIDNMSHGMCMIDSKMRIAVSNAEMSEYFGLPGTRSLQGVRFSALTRLAQKRGTLSAEDIGRLTASFDATFAPDSVARLETPGARGRLYDLTLKRHDEGGWVLVVQDITAQRQAREALDAAARFDPTTGLPNRRSFEERLTESLIIAGAQMLRTEVLFLDLDGFKQINDTLGHKFGDRVLVEAARRLREAVSEAYVSRWGGDEFVILRTGTDDDATLQYAQRIIAELSRPMWIEGAEVAVGASIGAAVCLGGAVSMDALLQQADMALYAAKRENRGGSRLYEYSMSELAHQRRLLELDLQAALAARTFELHYQPIVDIETGELVSFEALARWSHPTRGGVSPALFVPVLEDLNLMNAFGAWALQRACEDAVKWTTPVRVGVNVSTRQIDTLLESVRRALAISGLAADRLEIEITETAALMAGDRVRLTLEAVRALGVKVALDDFGTGYSSLSHLLQLPLDKVKIDKSFTQELGRSRKADVLVANIARISSQLGMRVTFEGIETVEQLDRARAIGVRAEGQGWLFGKPVSVKEIERLQAEAHQAVA